MSELTVGRIQELTTENNKLREANRRLQAEGPALERDKLVAGLREQVRELSSQLAIAESNAKVLAGRLIDTGEDAERLEAERDKLRAALEGLEWDDIDDLLTRDIEDCRRVGQTVADIQQNHIESAGQSRLRAEKAEAQLEQFARDIAAKLGIDYTPPVSKGECVYLKALEEMKEQLVEASQEVERLTQLITEHDGIECAKHDVLVKSAMEQCKRAEAQRVNAWALAHDWTVAALKHYPQNWAFDATNPEGMIANIVRGVEASNAPTPGCIDMFFQSGDRQAEIDWDTGVKTECVYAEETTERHWWTRGYSYKWRILRARKAEEERDGFKTLLEKALPIIERHYYYQGVGPDIRPEITAALHAEPVAEGKPQTDDLEFYHDQGDGFCYKCRKGYSECYCNRAAAERPEG